MKDGLMVKCKKNDNYDYDKRVIESCGNDFELFYNNIYEFDNIGYYGEIISEYYTICPNCGYMLLVDDSILDEEDMISIKKKNINECYLYKKNMLKSEYIHLEYLERKKNKTRVRKI